MCSLILCRGSKTSIGKISPSDIAIGKVVLIQCGLCAVSATAKSNIPAHRLLLKLRGILVYSDAVYEVLIFLYF